MSDRSDCGTRHRRNVQNIAVPTTSGSSKSHSPRGYGVGARITYPNRQQNLQEELEDRTEGVFARARCYTYEHLRVLLDEVVTFDLLLEAASSLAQAKLPVVIDTVLTGASDSVGKA